MPKFRISYTTEDWWRLDVDAATRDEAIDKFLSGEYNHDDSVMTESGYLQDSFDVEELDG